MTPNGARHNDVCGRLKVKHQGSLHTESRSEVETDSVRDTRTKSVINKEATGIPTDCLGELFTHSLLLTLLIQ